MKRLRAILLIMLVGSLSLAAIAKTNNSKKGFRERAKATKLSGDTTSYDEYAMKVHKSYNKERKEMLERYKAFRDSVLQDFINALGKDWAQKESDKPLPKPVDNSITPEVIVAPTPDPEPIVKPKKKVTPEPKPEPKKEITPEPKPEPKKEVTPEPKPEPKKEVTPEPKPEPKKEVTPEPKPEPKKEVTPEPKPEPKKEVTPELKPEPKKEVTPKPKPEPKKEVTPKPKPEPKKEVKPREKVQPKGVGNIKIDKIVEIPSIKAHVQPRPFVPVVIPEETTVDDKLEFELYGSTVAISIDDDCRFTLAGNDNRSVSKAVAEIAKNDKYSIVLNECIETRNAMKLCDWGYFMMLKKLSETFFGKECNEATLLTGYLYCMSGYKMRFAIEEVSGKLELCVACDQSVAGAPSLPISSDGGRPYYIFFSNYVGQTMFYICDYAMPKEKAMSLWINEEPSLPVDTRVAKRIPYFGSTPVAYKVNKNLVNFFDKYPTAAENNDPLSKWTHYTQSPMSTAAKESLYPELRKMIAGKSQYEAVKALQLFVEGFKYGYDDEIWGYDRPFFPEEMLYYPMSDCEDHAILFTRLVRDLLGLPTAFIYYPGHLASAVSFDDNQAFGDYIEADGKRFTVCDATYTGSTPGQSMPSMKGKPATLIIIK